ncbi:MAG: DUF188 domain-containing protein [Eubacteriales bacterium]|jgi:uncharacterized protein YaiI (UPF0178 family)|nr:DUF188 domain-containing protein [Eubacteriales bacterium]
MVNVNVCSGITAIRVDADACPVAVRDLIIEEARRRKIHLVFYIDENHELEPAYGQVRQVGQGRDAVDLVLVQDVRQRDLVITQDYGLAALVLAKKGTAIHPSGLVFSDQNIDRLLFERHLSGKMRRAGQRTTHQGKRRKEEDKQFANAFYRVLNGQVQFE